MAELQSSTQASTEAENPLVGLLDLMANLGEFQRLLERLADVAPSEIQQDMEVVRDVMADQMDVGAAASDPLGALVSSLGASLLNQRSFERVDSFAQENCGQPIFGL